MKVMLVVDSLYKGGAERVISNLSNYIVEENDTAIMTINGSYSEYILNSKIKRYSIISSNKVPVIFKPIKLLKKLLKIVKYKKEYRPDIVISFLPKSCFYVLFSNLFFKTKTIISVRNDPKREYNSIKKRLLMKLLYPTADGIVFQTEDAKKYFSKKIQNKSTIIPNPINPEFIGERFTGMRAKIIVNVGRLSEQKNQKLLIDAFATISKNYKDYKLFIYGEGELRNGLEDRVKEYNLENRVFLPGNVDNIKEHIVDSSMFVLSSLYEGMPNTLMEAMALGVPCISTDCPSGGPRFLIKDNVNGILVPNNNKDELVMAIKRIIDDKRFANKISNEAHKICDKLHPNKINKMWLDYIKSIVSNEALNISIK